MKYLIVIFLSVLFFYGCSKEGDKPKIEEKNKFAYDSTDIKTLPVDNPNEQFEMIYKFEPGKKYSYRITSISHDMQTIQADTLLKQDVTQTIIYLFDLNVKELDEEKNMEMLCTINSVKIDAEGEGKKFTYQSGVTKDSAELSKYAEYQCLINNPFNLRVNKFGELLEFYKTDKIAAAFLEIRNLTDSATAQDKEMIKKNIVDGALKPLMAQVIRKLPEKNLAKDSTWTNPQPAAQMLVFQIENTTKFKIKSLEMLEDDKLAVIDASMDTKITGDTKATDRGVSYEFKKPVTTASGKIFYNITDGCVEKSRTKTTFDIFYTVEMPTPKGLQKGSRKQVIENTNIVERL